MKTKKSFLSFAVLLCAVCFALVSCGKDPDPPKPSTTLETISITAPTVKEANRTITDKVGEYSYADKADATVKMTFKNAEPATKDSAVVANLTSKIVWLTTPVEVALTGALPTLKPTLSGTDKITVKYGTFEAKDFFTVTNTEYSVTRSGVTAKMPFFGFSKVEAVGDAVNAVTYATEDGKNYEINTFTQKAKITHTDGTTKEVDIVLMKLKKEVSKVLVSYAEDKSKFVGTLTYYSSEDYQIYSMKHVVVNSYNTGEKEEVVINSSDIDYVYGTYSNSTIGESWDFSELVFKKISSKTGTAVVDGNLTKIPIEEKIQWYMPIAKEDQLRIDFTLVYTDFVYKDGGLEALTLTGAPEIKYISTEIGTKEIVQDDETLIWEEARCVMHFELSFGNIKIPAMFVSPIGVITYK